MPYGIDTRDAKWIEGEFATSMLGFPASPRPLQLFTASDGTHWIFKTARVDQRKGYWFPLFDNRSSGLGDIWQTIGGAASAGIQAYGAYSQVNAQQNANRPPSLQAQMDQVWAQVQQVFAQLLTAAQGSPQAAQQALQQGAQVQAQYAQVQPQFASLCCTQAQGVANRIAEWMQRLQQLASAGGSQQQQPAGSVPNGNTQGGGQVEPAMNQWILPAAIIGLAIMLKG
jgi:hypothetical protein